MGGGASPQWGLLLLLIGARFSRETVAAQQPNWRVRWLPEAVSSMFRVSLASGHGFHHASKGPHPGAFQAPEVLPRLRPAPGLAIYETSSKLPLPPARLRPRLWLRRSLSRPFRFARSRSAKTPSSSLRAPASSRTSLLP